MKDTQMSITQGPRCFFNYIKKKGKATIKPYNKASWRGIVQIFSKKISEYKKGKSNY